MNKPEYVLPIFGLKEYKNDINIYIQTIEKFNLFSLLYSFTEYWFDDTEPSYIADLFYVLMITYNDISEVLYDIGYDTIYFYEELWSSGYIEDFNSMAPTMYFNNCNNELKKIEATDEHDGINKFVLTTLTIEFYQKYKDRKISTKVLSPFYMSLPKRKTLNSYDVGIPCSRIFASPTIFSPYITKWKNLYKTITQEYDMLKPFDIELEESISGTANLNDDDYTSDSTEKIYAFNSSNSGDGVPTSKTGETTHRSTNSDRDESRNYTRKGNIGNKSQAQLIMEERQKAMFNLKEIIFEDIASVLCRKTYTK